jgi:hypothetical protein
MIRDKQEKGEKTFLLSFLQFLLLMFWYDRSVTVNGVSITARYGTVNPLNTHVAPAVRPMLGSREVIPKIRPRSARTVP